MKWTPTQAIDKHPDIVLIFHGLLCLCNNDDGFCEIGIHNRDAGRHKFSIYVCEVAASFDPPVNTDTGGPVLQPVECFDAGHTGSSATDKVLFEFESSHDPVKFLLREPRKSHPNDFSFMIDLEGPEFYAGDELRKKPNAMGPRLHVPHGVFYTLYKTKTEFERVTGDYDEDRLDVDSVARIVAANVYLNDGESVTITARDKSFRMTPTADVKYLVVVDNGCPTSVCNFEPDNNENDAKRNDFNHYYETFHVPSGKKKFKLKKKVAASTPPPDDTFLGKLEKLLDIGGSNKSSDDAPCGASGFGNSGSLNRP